MPVSLQLTNSLTSQNVTLKNKRGKHSKYNPSMFNNLDEKFKLQLKLMRLRRGIDLRIELHPIEIKNFHYNNYFANEILMHGIKIN